MAAPDADYRSVNRTAPKGEFLDANAAETTFAMPAQNVTVTAAFVEIDERHLPLKAGWNLVSVPVVPEDTSVEAVFAGTEVVYAWDAAAGSYYMPTEVEPHRGYCVAVMSDTIITVSGVPVYSWPADISAGRNLIGSVCQSVDFSTPDTEPPGKVEPFSFRRVPGTGYTLDTTIEPAMGHWVAATDDCALTLSAVDELVLGPTTVIVDEETEDVLTSVTEEQDILTFGASTPLLDALESGDVYPYVYHWNPVALSYTARPLDDIRPGEGYWLLGFTGFSLSVVHASGP